MSRGPRRIRMGPGAEFDRIRDFAAAAGADPVGGGEVRVLPGDDAVALAPREGELVVLGTDATVEGIHFRRAWATWETVGYRAVAAALSDLAAMAARPVGVLVTLLLPPELDRDVVGALGEGAGACLRAAEAVLLGGDLSRSSAGVVVDVVGVGSAQRPVRRDGARPGDALWVTGELGAAATAVSDWESGLEPDPRARRAYRRPVPRLREARWLTERAGVHAMIDLSDGLAGDVRHLASASGVGVELVAEDLPLAPVVAEFPNRKLALGRALHGGEDYELLLAAPEAAGELREAFRRRFDTELTRVGRVVEDGEVTVVLASGARRTLRGGGFDHFARDRGDG